ncbi:MAG: ATP-dependent DNA helicase RecG [Actinomycetaceae bacterium]|nr:ATP-dependent DNA helicase RecG [Actinomycetaceae bacterium]
MAVTSDFLNTPLERLIGKRNARKLERLHLKTARDLLYHFPRRFDKWGQLTPMRNLVEGADVTVMAQVVDTRMNRTRGGKWRLCVTITDGDTYMDVVFWAKNPHMLSGHQQRLVVGDTFYFAGKIGTYRQRLQLTYPDYDGASEDTESPVTKQRLDEPIPIYPSTAKLHSWALAKAIDTVLLPMEQDDKTDPIPADIRQRYDLPGLVEAFHMYHHPQTDGDWQKARKRFQYEEALVLQTYLAQARARARNHPAPICDVTQGQWRKTLLDSLPFHLTTDQSNAVEHLEQAMSCPQPMNVLLQGDVGSGKTIVAVLAMLQAVDAGYQAALLAPTSVLATQHFQSIMALIGKVDAPVHLLAAATPACQRATLLQMAQSGQPLIIVGTHALLSDDVTLPQLALLVVDEQHRFGVTQRGILRDRAKTSPHVMVMTATPIPRTVAMTVFGDMDTIVMKNLPTGRQPVNTYIVPRSRPAWIDRMWQRVREEIDSAGRVFIVCPRVDDADTSLATGEPRKQTANQDSGSNRTSQVTSLASVEAMTKELPTVASIADVGFSVVTGRSKPQEKNAAMTSFINGHTPILLATTVIEVGVDVPDATMIIIMDADHFGLSQLHQLRGRVGRGNKAAVCMAVTNAQPGTAPLQRLEAFASTNNGFELAEKDLELRKEGNILGAQQSGNVSSLQTLSLADKTVVSVICDMRREAIGIIERDPQLNSLDYSGLCQALQRLDTEEEAFLERG